MITFGHVSDLHIDLGERATERAQRLIAALKAMSGLDAVLVTGDIADHGTAAEYRLVRELLAELEGPVLAGLPAGHPAGHPLPLDPGNRVRLSRTR